ncbi:MAG: glycosyl transferase family 2 [Chloroflexi bacterium HGW-Chloroflexi-10]|nr:MAG: glycosyl transferase family 2 [Chloroflexi bacterium HGW-Chloroflexi-10]
MTQNLTQLPSNANHHIAVVIPAYQAAKKIGTVLQNIPDFVKTIIVVDDGSKDNTAEVVQACKDERITLIRHTVNQGVGQAMLTGYEQALKLGAEIVIKMDSDDQMDPAKIPALINPLLNGKADFTKGNRFLFLDELIRMPFIRRMGNLALSFFVKAASGYWSIFDPTNGYTAIHHTALKSIRFNRIAHDYFFETSMLMELGRAKAVVQDVSIPARYGDETSHLSIKRILISFPARLIRGLFKRIIFQYFLLSFEIVSLYLVVGFPLILFGSVWGIYHWIRSIITLVPATSGTVLIAVLPIILGFQLLLQALSTDLQSEPKEALQQRKY